jgi:short subunit fatty acids transporter
MLFVSLFTQRNLAPETKTLFNMKAFMKSVVLFMEIFSPAILISAFVVIYMMTPNRDKRESIDSDLTNNYSLKTGAKESNIN